MYYLSFDQASVITGYSIFDEEKLIDYGKFKNKDSLNYAEKISETSNFIIETVKKYLEKGKVMVSIEEIQLQANVETFKKLAQLQGAIISDLSKLDIEPDIVSASSWKSHVQVRGKGRTEQKRNAQKKVSELFGVKVTQDEADAILIGLFSVNQGFNW